MPRLVRRAPLSERLKNYLNPLDFLLWLSGELNGLDWDEYKEWSIPAGLVINLVFLIARANTSLHQEQGDDDIFGEYEGKYGSGWFNWLCSSVVYLLSMFSFANAFYTFYRKRHYRLFENSIEVAPSTPNARRLILMELNTFGRLAFGTLRLFVCAVFVSSALAMFCVTAVTALLLCALLSAQLSMLQTSFSQQVKDTALVHKEVLNEYDAKYVHPSLTQVVREVSTQTQSEKTGSSEVDVSNPFYLINRGFKINPNPAYSTHYDPVDHLQKRKGMQQRHQYESRANSTPNLSQASRPTYESESIAPAHASHFASSSVTSGTELSSPLKPAQSRPNIAYRQNQPNFYGDGGSLGVYQHAASPIRKAASHNILRSEESELLPRRREGSPLKRVSTPGGGLSQRFEKLRGYGGRRDSGRI